MQCCLSLTPRFATVIPEPKTPECIFSFPHFPTSANFSKCCHGGGLVTKSYLTLATPWTVSCQASLSMGSADKNPGVGYHLLLQGIFLTQGLNLVSFIVGGFFTN